MDGSVEHLMVSSVYQLLIKLNYSLCRTQWLDMLLRTHRMEGKLLLLRKDIL